MKRFLFFLLIFLLFPLGFLGAADNGSNALFPISTFYRTPILFDVNAVFTSPHYRDALKKLGYTDAMLPPLKSAWMPARPRNHDYLSIEDRPDYESIEQAYKTLDKAFEQAYYHNRARLYFYALAQNGAGAVILPLLLSTVFVGVYYGGIDPNFFLGALIAYQIVYYMSEGITGNMGLLMARLWPSNDPLTQLELAYFKKKYMFLYPGLKKATKLFEEKNHVLKIEGKFYTARTSSNNTESATDYIDAFMKVPLISAYPFDDEGALQRLIGIYDDEDRCVLLRAIKAHKGRYQGALGYNKHKLHRPFLYLVSHYGCGKGYFVKKIAKALKVPYGALSLAGIKTKEDLFGSKEKPGLLLEVLMRVNARNPVIDCDEFDKAIEKNPELSTHLLPLLDTSSKSFYSDYLAMDIDISHVFFIFSGNEDITHAAIADRFQKEHVARMRIDSAKKIVEALYKGNNEDWRAQLLARAAEETWTHGGKTYYRFRGAQSLLQALQAE